MRADRSRWVVVLALAIAVLSTAIGAAAAQALPLKPCGSGAGDRSRCARVTVPLDHDGAVPGTISLLVRALPPSHGPATETVIALAGGPGQAATPLLDGFASVLGSALRTRQLVTFDQRGTGGSGQLVCGALETASSVAAAVSDCAAELGPRRVTYTTAQSVADVEAVRAAFGVERIVLYGTSYGTKVALAYAAAYPQHVERLVLDSVVLPTGIDPFERTTLASIRRVLRTLCAGNCRFTHDPVADLAALVRRLAVRPLRGSAIDPAGHPQRVSLGRADLLGMLIAGDLDPALRAAFPAAVHAALKGDAAPLLRLGAGGGSNALTAVGDSSALYLATSCEDGSLPWAVGTPVQQRRAAVDAASAAVPSAAFAPFDRATARAFGNADLCRAWPEAPIAQTQPPLPATPTLILSGDDDLRTPRSDAVKLAGLLPGAQLVQVPDAGHSVLGADPTGCAAEAMAAFLAGKVPGRCRPHRRALPTLPPPPRRLSALRTLRGVSAKAGRTIGAVVLTLGDVTDQIVEQSISGSGDVRSFGGLRAGSASVNPARGVRLRGYSYVPGVTLTGTIPSRAKSYTLTIGGTAALRGRLTLSAKQVGGVLGGMRVHVPAKQLRRSPLATVAAAAVPLAPAGAAWPALLLAPALRGHAIGR